MLKYLTLLLLTFPPVLIAQTVKIDESKAKIAFVFVEDDVDGTFGEFIFTGNINLSDIDNAVFSGSVGTETLDTNNWLRNRILRSKKNFNAREFPKLTFKSTSIKGGANKEFLVRGTLTIKGISKPVTLTFSKTPNGFYAGTMINSSDFDINIYDEKERNRVQIMITLPYSVADSK